MEEMNPRYGEGSFMYISSKQSRKGDKEWSSSLGVVG
jgi:hypothetical protein